jgi:hypothetical protein
MRRIFVSLILALVLAAMIAGTASAASPNGVAPFHVMVDRVEKHACPDFAVHVEASGLEKIIVKPDGSLLIPHPGIIITLTNVEEPDNQVTLHNSFVLQEKPLPDGTTSEVILGRVLTGPGLKLRVGRTTYRYDSDTGKLIEKLSTQGQVIDLCAILA